MKKELLRKRFASALASYDDNAEIQKNMAKTLCGYLSGDSYEKILEIGCGTGFLTKNITDRVKFSSYEAFDIVPECENYIKKISDKINFCQKDIDDFIKTSDSKKYDLIISNAAFQWVEDLRGLIKTLYEKLNDNGELIFSTFGTENYSEIRYIIGIGLKYFSKSELESMLKGYDYTISEEIRIKAFDSPRDVLRHIKLTGVNSVEEKFWTKKDLSDFENAYNSLCPRRTTLTYHPVFVKIVKRQNSTVG